MGLRSHSTKSELTALEFISEDIDQLSATARDCAELAPKLKRALDLAWFLAEEALRESGRGSCGHAEVVTKPYCGCCAHFGEVRTGTQMLRMHL